MITITSIVSSLRSWRDFARASAFVLVAKPTSASNREEIGEESS